MAIVADIARLARCLDFFEDFGYTRVELPWAVPFWVTQLTCDGTEKNTGSIGEQALVGSAEQSFLYCDWLGRLPSGKYVGMTPCFRPGDNRDEFHQETFYKVELYRTDAIDRYVVDEMLLALDEFVRIELRNEEFLLEVVETPEQNGHVESIGLWTTKSCDLTLNGIEIGSYGLRRNGDFEWAYGTGLAEPRFSQAALCRAPFESSSYPKEWK